MMIRINLLPVRQGKKREAGRQVVALFAAALVAALVLNFLWWNSRASVASRNDQEIAGLTAEIDKLKKEIGKVDEIKQRTKEVQEKLKVLDELKKGRSGPVRLLDALATAMPKKAWLKDFDEKSNQVRMTGFATSHDEVAEMMRSLDSVVWTPKGMGRVVEERFDTQTVRIELLAQNNAIEEFPSAAVGHFFTGIELKKAEQVDAKQGAIPIKLVDFELTFQANYTI
jgi:type IV pilus assembly protein PilN